MNSNMFTMTHLLRKDKSEKAGSKSARRHKEKRKKKKRKERE